MACGDVDYVERNLKVNFILIGILTTSIHQTSRLVLSMIMIDIAVGILKLKWCFSLALYSSNILLLHPSFPPLSSRHFFHSFRLRQLFA